MPIQFQLTGQPVTVSVDPARLLLWTLRGELSITGTKFGCGVGICGACTVLMDGQPVRACMTSIKDVAGHAVVTI